MTAPPGRRGGGSRQATLAKARQSRRPSRLGQPAGAATPEHVLPADAGFPGLVARAWERATAAPTLASAVDTLLTLGGHVPSDVQLRALRSTDEAALEVLCGVSWRDDGRDRHEAIPPSDEDDVVFRGELGLTTGGRVVLRDPSQGPLAREYDLVDGVIRVPWSAQTLADYQDVLKETAARSAHAAADCRQWLASRERGLTELLERLTEAAQRTAPFVLYQEDRQYTNFREGNTITGKTLWPGHPDCAFSRLRNLPLNLWSDNDVVLVVCLTLLVRSAGYARIEEANGTQLSVDHVAFLLERTRHAYNTAAGEPHVPPAATTGVEELTVLAERIAAKRREIVPAVQLYREIHGPLMHKIERVAGPPGDACRRREEAVCARLRSRLPLTGATMDDLGAAVAAAPDWLSRPHGEFGTGLEAVVYETVAAAQHAFDADFAMSRGMRSLPRLIQALRDQDWTEIIRWDLPDYFCCVVPSTEADGHFDSRAHLADMAWAMSARMQYNSWHFIAGNLPKVPEVQARDYFAPPLIPDVAHYSDQHHRGHVAARVRFSIRSPQAVTVLDRRFAGFVDLRLLRCVGEPFGEQDVLAAHRTSAFIATVTELAASLVAGGAGFEVTAFDSAWHWRSIAATDSDPDPGSEAGR